MVHAREGMRVRVWSPNEKEYWGLGTIEKVEELIVEGMGKLSNDYPSIIKLDSGKITQGLDCWWISDRSAKLAEAKIRKEKGIE
jgi:hypothetical protein